MAASPTRLAEKGKSSPLVIQLLTKQTTGVRTGIRGPGIRPGQAPQLGQAAQENLYGRPADLPSLRKQNENYRLQ